MNKNNVKTPFPHVWNGVFMLQATAAHFIHSLFNVNSLS